MATPPIIAVEFLCQRSVFGLATNPQRRANVRTNGVNKSASANETTGGIRLDKLRENIVCKLRGKAIRLERQRQVRKNLPPRGFALQPRVGLGYAGIANERQMFQP